MCYTTKQTLEFITKKQMLYQKAPVFYTGKTIKDDNGHSFYYTEVIAEDILKKLKTNESLSNILQIWTRDERFREEFEFKHDGVFNKDSNRREENFCKELCFKNKELNTLGKSVEYQANIIKGTKINVDLITQNENDNSLYLVEVKGYDDSLKEDEKSDDLTSKETLLRAALEIESYYRLLNKKSERKNKTGLQLLQETNTKINNERDSDVKKAILVPKKSQAWIEYDQLKKGFRPEIEKLIKELDIEVYSIEDENVSDIFDK